MPRLNTSTFVCKNIVDLIEALRLTAQDRESDSEATIAWLPESPSTIRYEGLLSDLFQLAHNRQPKGIEKDQLRNQLRVLEEAGLLDDQRSRTQGAKHWHFTIMLASRTDRAVNNTAVLAAIAPLRGRPWSKKAVEAAGLDIEQALPQAS